VISRAIFKCPGRRRLGRFLGFTVYSFLGLSSTVFTLVFCALYLLLALVFVLVCCQSSDTTEVEGVGIDLLCSHRQRFQHYYRQLQSHRDQCVQCSSSLQSPECIRTASALALCYSAAEYCAPVWSRSAHTSQVDVQLNSTMHLICG